MTKPKKKWPKIAVISVSVLVLLWIAVILGRGWMREGFVPHVMAYPAKKSLEKSYTQARQSIDQSLKDLKFSLADTASGSCNLSTAAGLQTRVYCNAGTDGTTETSDDYITWFKQNSAEVEKQIIAAGWTKTWNAAQPINELYKDPDNNYSVGVNYEKYYGKNLCTFSTYYNAYEKDPSQLRYSLGCTRYVNFLGDPDS